MDKVSIRERIDYLKTIGAIDKDSFSNNKDLTDIDKDLINTAYDLSKGQLKIIHIDDGDHGTWEGYIGESYEEMMERVDILNQRTFLE